MELARLQQAARDARRDASNRSRDQARLERSEKAELAKREKEARSQQLLEHINKNRTQLTIEPVPTVAKTGIDEWKTPEIVMGPATKTSKERIIPPISLSLIPVTGPKDQNSPIKTLKFDQSGWKEEYNALDKMKDFAEKAAFDLPKRKDKNFDFTLVKSAEKRSKAPEKTNNLEKLIESYSRITEFINGCDWSQIQGDKKTEDPKAIEQKYLNAKNEFMSQNLMLMPKESPKSVLKEVIDLSEDDDILTDIMSKKINKGTFSVGKDGALSISVHPLSKETMTSAKRRKHEEIEKQKIEEQAKRQQEREIKRQQAILLKEQERERRRQHTSFIRQLDSRRRWEERERRKHQNLLDRLLVKERKLQQRRREMELLSELRRPQEDSSLSDQKPLPTLPRIPGLKLPAQAMADLLQAYEFTYTFGEALGFDMETMPTLNTLQMGILGDCSEETEEEFVQVVSQLLIIAVEDPGIPHPGRHTTLLGHAIRMGDITHQNFSEVLRIYLYANATGEVKALTGLTAERERERRVADHHQTEAEMQHTCANSKNSAYYEHLHNNATYKLSEELRDKTFTALNATTKARIFAYICDELLQNKTVLSKIDSSLEHLTQLRKERYLMDMKIRKVRVLQARKARAEQAERSQALALERMQRLVDDSTRTTTPPLHDDENQQTPEKDETPKKDKESSPHPESETDKHSEPSPYKEPPPTEESDKELSPLKDLSNNMKNKEMMNNNKDECSLADNSKIDKDSMIGDCDANLSDLESEGTQPEEDEDKNLSSEELARKLDKLLKQSEQQLLQLTAASHALRATCFGQDRYWRRYWSLGKCGGIFVEGMESAQPEIMAYHQQLENNALNGSCPTDGNKKKKKGTREKKESPTSDAEKRDPETEAQKKEEALKSEMELKSIKSELNLSDHTQIIKYEPNVKHGACKVEGSSIKMEEKYIQQKNNDEQDMLDIEDSIPTAFLVQKPTHKPMFAAQAEQMDKPQEIVKVENVVKNENENETAEESKDSLVNNLEELRKMAEAVSIQLDAAKKEQEIKEEKEKVKKEAQDPNSAHLQLYSKMLDGKWFSILRHESSFLNNINDEKQDLPEFCDNEHTCSEIIMCQGHKWDVSNNLHLLNDPSLFTLNSMVTSVQVPSNNVYADSSLTMSGLDQDLIDNSFNKDGGVQEAEVEEDNKEQDNDLEKELQADALKQDMLTQKAKANSLNSLGLLNFNALSTYVTCDSPPPIQMSAEELDQLEYCKVHGLPKKIEGNYVPKELRHGWWRITSAEQVSALLGALHPRGVRERELHAALLAQLPLLNNKPYIDKGDIIATELCVSHLDRVIAMNGGYATDTSFSAATQRKVDMQLLSMVEQLEERVAAASMQVKGWRPTRATADAAPSEPVARAKHKLQVLEAHIERRYLKPPFVQRYASTTEATLGAVLQAEHGNASAPSPQNADGGSEGKVDNKGIARGLANWREALSRCTTSAQLAMMLQALEAAIAWDKSIMKAVRMRHNCQFCLCGDNEDQLLLCDGCDKGYHTYCFKPSMDKIPDGDWYCWECINKARGERVCIVCGGRAHGAARTIPCALCARAYHQDCHYPPLLKVPLYYCGPSPAHSARAHTIRTATTPRYSRYHYTTADHTLRTLRARIPSGLPLPPATQGTTILLRTIPCALCARAYHQDCHYPPLLKVPLYYCGPYPAHSARAHTIRTATTPRYSRYHYTTADHPLRTLRARIPSGLPLPPATQGTTILLRTIPCALCARAYHQDCHYPPLLKVPLYYCGPYPAHSARAHTIRTATTPRYSRYHYTTADHTLRTLRARIPSGLPLPPATQGTTILLRTIPCALCARAYHQDCHYPPLLKNPRGKWYCSQCISKAPPKKPRNTKKRDAKHRDLNTSLDIDQNMVPSPAASHASTSTTAEECSGSALHTPEKHDDKLEDTIQDNENGINHAGELSSEEGPPEKRRAVHYVGGNGALQHDDTDAHIDGEDRDTENVPLMSRAKKEKNSAKKLLKDLQFCKNLLCEMECHEHAWPFLLPVNTKQFPQYKKVIKCPMDLSTIKRKLQDNIYKCKEEFASDVRLMFSNCEVFNEDDSPVGRAGHNMRQFFDDRWAQI
ncbi:unnamed protein product [Spodoptera exigua]|nr:unnamed protein product [Spodoptera exigua]